MSNVSPQQPRVAQDPTAELADFLDTLRGPAAVSPQNPLSQQAAPSANKANPLMNPSNPGAFNNPANPQLNPDLPGATTNPSNPQYNPFLPGSQNNPANPQFNPAMPGATNNPANPQLNPSFPGSVTNPSNPIHNPDYPNPDGIGQAPSNLGPNASFPPKTYAAVQVSPTGTDDTSKWGWHQRRPAIFDPTTQMLHVGPDGWSHPQLLQEMWGTPTAQQPQDRGDYEVSMGWYGRNEEALPKDYVFNRGRPNEVGWYAATPRPSMEAHQALQAYAQQNPIRALTTASVRVGDNYTQDTREWADPTEPRASEAPMAAGCTCPEGHKLDCPIHGMDPVEPDLDHTWSLPQGWPIGYPQDQPRGWTDAVHSRVGKTVKIRSFKLGKYGKGMIQSERDPEALIWRVKHGWNGGPHHDDIQHSLGVVRPCVAFHINRKGEFYFHEEDPGFTKPADSADLAGQVERQYPELKWGSISAEEYERQHGKTGSTHDVKVANAAGTPYTSSDAQEGLAQDHPLQGLPQSHPGARQAARGQADHLPALQHREPRVAAGNPEVDWVAQNYPQFRHVGFNANGHPQYKYFDSNGNDHLVTGWIGGGSKKQAIQNVVPNLKRQMYKCLNGACDHVFGLQPGDVMGEPAVGQPEPEARIMPGTLVSHEGQPHYVTAADTIDGTHVYDLAHAQSGEPTEMVGHDELGPAAQQRAASGVGVGQDESQWVLAHHEHVDGERVALAVHQQGVVARGQDPLLDQLGDQDLRQNALGVAAVRHLDGREAGAGSVDDVDHGSSLAEGPGGHRSLPQATGAVWTAASPGPQTYSHRRVREAAVACHFAELAGRQSMNQVDPSGNECSCHIDNPNPGVMPQSGERTCPVHGDAIQQAAFNTRAPRPMQPLPKPNTIFAERPPMQWPSPTLEPWQGVRPNRFGHQFADNGTHACPNCGQGVVSNGWTGWTPMTGDQFGQRSWQCPSCAVSWKDYGMQPLPHGHSGLSSPDEVQQTIASASRQGILDQRDHDQWRLAHLVDPGVDLGTAGSIGLDGQKLALDQPDAVQVGLASWVEQKADETAIVARHGGQRPASADALVVAPGDPLDVWHHAHGSAPVAAVVEVVGHRRQEQLDAHDHGQRSESSPLMVHGGHSHGHADGQVDEGVDEVGHSAHHLGAASDASYPGQLIVAVPDGVGLADDVSLSRGADDVPAGAWQVMEMGIHDAVSGVSVFGGMVDPARETSLGVDRADDERVIHSSAHDHVGGLDRKGVELGDPLDAPSGNPWIVASDQHGVGARTLDGFAAVDGGAQRILGQIDQGVVGDVVLREGVVDGLQLRGADIDDGLDVVVDSHASHHTAWVKASAAQHTRTAWMHSDEVGGMIPDEGDEVDGSRVHEMDNLSTHLQDGRALALDQVWQLMGRTAANQLMYHVAPYADHSRVMAHGIDWRKRDRSRDWREPGDEEFYPYANYLTTSLPHAREYAQASSGNIYGVDTTGMAPMTHDVDDDWGNTAWHTSEPIGPERVSLVEPHPQWDRYARAQMPGSAVNTLSTLPRQTSPQAHAHEGHNGPSVVPGHLVEDHNHARVLFHQPEAEAALKPQAQRDDHNQVHLVEPAVQQWHTASTGDHPVPVGGQPLAQPLGPAHDVDVPVGEVAAHAVQASMHEPGHALTKPSVFAMRAPLLRHKRVQREIGRSAGDRLYQTCDANGSSIGGSNGSHRFASMAWQPGGWGKGLTLDGQLHTWPTEGPGGSPHHQQYLKQIGRGQPEGDASRGVTDGVVIAPDGSYTLQYGFQSENPVDPSLLARTQPGMRYVPDQDRWARRAFGSLSWSPMGAGPGPGSHLGGLFKPWRPGENGKGFVSPMGNVIHWRTDGPDGYPGHREGLVQTGYHHHMYAMPIGEGPSASNFFEVSPDGYVIPSHLQDPEGYQKIVNSHPSFTDQRPAEVNPMQTVIRQQMAEHPEQDWGEYTKAFPDEAQYWTPVTAAESLLPIRMHGGCPSCGGLHVDDETGECTDCGYSIPYDGAEANHGYDRTWDALDDVWRSDNANNALVDEGEWGPRHWGSWRLAETESKAWEGKMYHGSPRGLLGPVRTPFWTTADEEEAKTKGAVHPVSVRFQRPSYMHLFDESHRQLLEPEMFDGIANMARGAGHDGIVVHDYTGGEPKRTLSIALDPGSVVPGHDHEWPY